MSILVVGIPYWMVQEEFDLFYVIARKVGISPLQQLHQPINILNQYVIPRHNHLLILKLTSIPAPIHCLTLIKTLFIVWFLVKMSFFNINSTCNLWGDKRSSEWRIWRGEVVLESWSYSFHAFWLDNWSICFLFEINWSIQLVYSPAI